MSLTGDGSASRASGDVEEHPTFGAYTVVSSMGDGRFGPVFRATGPDQAVVVVRTFTIPLSDSQRDRLVAALTTLCQRPLDHPSIARPIACGLQGGRPYLVHSYLPGTSLADLTNAHIPLALPDVIVRLTYLAGALDFAEAGGVLHGALGAHDAIFSDENAGVSGFGLVQALEAAGIPGFHARRDDDVAALIGIARDLLGDRVSPAVAAVLAAPAPGTALGFASALQATLPVETAGEPVPPVDAPLPPFLAAPTVAPASPARPSLPFDAPDDAPLTETTQGGPADLLDIPLSDSPGPAAFAIESTPYDEPPAYQADGFDAAPVPAPAPYEIDPPIADARPMFGAADAAPVAHRPRGLSTGWVLTGVVALALGIFTGYAGGFFVGSDTPPTPATAAANAPATVPAPEATNGRTYTDAAVDEPKTPESITSTPLAPVPAGSPSAGAASSVPAAAAPNPSATETSRVPSGAGREAATRPVPAPAAPVKPAPRVARPQPVEPPPSGPAAMRVDSLPAGAQVFVDGRSVGYTPMVVGDLTPGTHSIRMQLPGYHPWVTAVTLGPGARERVAASLEQ